MLNLFSFFISVLRNTSFDRRLLANQILNDLSIFLSKFSVLLLAVVVQRRKTDDLYKDADDIRENIINYEDEGGGEGDMTGYDLNVLRLMYDGDGQPMAEKTPIKDCTQGRGESISFFANLVV